MSTFAIFSAQYLPHMGGVERYTYNIASTLIRRGHKVIVVTSKTGDLPLFENSEGIKVLRVPCLNLLEGRYPVLLPGVKFFTLWKKLKRLNVDYVMVNTRFYLHSLFGMAFAKINCIPCITVEHGTSHLTIHNPVWDKIGQIFEHCLTRVDRWFCKEFYGVSMACNEWLRHFGIESKGVIYNSIDPTAFQKLAQGESESFRYKNNVKPGAVAIAFTGRLIKEKGILQLVHVMNRLHEKYPEIVLFIAGDGDLEEEIREQKSSYIIPLGRLEYKQVAALLSETDIFCLPSFSEGFSTSLLEAAVWDNYIITTARGGARELLPDDAYGTVIEHNDEETLYNAFEQILSDPDRRAKAVELTRKRVYSRFTWEAAVDKLESIFEEKTN